MRGLTLLHFQGIDEADEKENKAYDFTPLENKLGRVVRIGNVISLILGNQTNTKQQTRNTSQNSRL